MARVCIFWTYVFAHFCDITLADRGKGLFKIRRKFNRESLNFNMYRYAKNDGRG